MSGTKRWPNGDEFTGTFTANADSGQGKAKLSAKPRMTLLGTFQGNGFQETKSGMCYDIGGGNIHSEEQVRILQRKLQTNCHHHCDHHYISREEERRREERRGETQKELEMKHQINELKQKIEQLSTNQGYGGIQLVVRMAVEKRFGVDESQQLVSLVVGATQDEVSLSGTSSTLSQLYYLLTSLIRFGKEEGCTTTVAQLKVRMKPVMAMKESDLIHVSPLGSGCYGAVYRCLHTPSSREVAVKKLFEVIASAHNMAKFKLEAEIVRGLGHPNIVRCLGICVGSGGYGYLIVSELMCCSLRQLLKQIRGDHAKRQLSFREVAAIALGVSKGMDSLHRQNIMHRDLSSNNVLFDSNGTPKICDFGVSRGMNTLAMSSGERTISPGTPIHMAPQMYTNHYSMQGDMWGFGVLLTEMINCDIVDSTFDKLPLRSQVSFMEEQMKHLSAPDVEEVQRLCRESSESAVAHCLSRRNACLDIVIRHTHVPDSLAQVQTPAAADLMFLIAHSCLSILVTDDQVTNSITQWLSSLSPFISLAATKPATKDWWCAPRRRGAVARRWSHATSRFPEGSFTTDGAMAAAKGGGAGVAMVVDDTTSAVGGGVYTGRLVDGTRDGSGTCKWANGDVYAGDWKDGRQHGRGVCKWANGNTYEGEWHKGNADGWGVGLHPDGWRYEGLWRDNCLKRGTWHDSNGANVSYGEWVWNAKRNQYEMQGCGVQTRRTNNTGINGAVSIMETVYEGGWDRNQWHGVGTWRSPDGSGAIYHGQFDHGKKCGTGRILFGDDGGNNNNNNSQGGGGSYVGEWKDDMFHGSGVRLWANGDRYDGKWVCGMENGEGTKTWSRDGSSFTGLWESGVPTKGTRRWPNGSKFESTFTRDGEQKLKRELSKEKSDLKASMEEEMRAAEKEWQKATERNNQQHAEQINEVNKNLQQLQDHLHKKQEEEETTKMIAGKAHPELKEAFTLATLFQSQLQKSSPEIVLLEESLAKLNQRLQGATESNEALSSRLKELTELKATLVNKLTESDDACKKLLGQTLTVQNSETEIQECARNISTLTKKVLKSSTTSTSEMENSLTVQKEESDRTVEGILMVQPVTVPDEPVGSQFQRDDTFKPPFQLLCDLSDTLEQLQRCHFDKCTKLVDKHTVLSKELSEQVSIGGTLCEAIKDTQRECSELQREVRGKWKLRRGLEGDEEFIGMPGVWSMLSQLLPQAQQAIVDLMVSKATLLGSSSHQHQLQHSPGATTTTTRGTASHTTLPGCTANPSNICMECDERPPNVQFQPCGHVVLCSECAAFMKKCPDCRVIIKDKINLLL
ncbi:MORN repeat family protein [Pelomyxa schiedti]|nr:MORN repeat family protein [Pelomyxa schiedti]